MKRTRKLTIELPLWTAFVLQRVAEKRKKTVGELIEEAMTFILRNQNVNQIKRWSFDYRKKYKLD